VVRGGLSEYISSTPLRSKAPTCLVTARPW
jgi:hypothetical protein